MSTITASAGFHQERIVGRVIPIDRYRPVSHPTSEDIAASKRSRRNRRKPELSSFRIADLNREFSNRYGRTVLPDDDAGREDVWIMLNHLAFARVPRTRIANWLAWRASWFDDDDLVDQIIKEPMTFKADPLAKRLGLTFARRTALGITTIGAIDMSKKQRAELRAAKEVARRRESRRVAGATPRAEIEQTSIERQKPWIAMGVSRATWFRKHRIKPPKTQRVANVVPFETGVTGSNSIESLCSQTSLTSPIAYAVVNIGCT